MNGSIYLLKNNHNEKVYVGRTVQSVDNRFKQHLKLLESNKKQAIYKAIKEIGKENFSYEVLETGIMTYEKLNELEEMYITKHNSIFPNGYNLCPGGVKWRRLPKLTESQESDIVGKYVIEGKSTRAISDIYNVSHHTINNVLKKNDVQIRKKACNLPDRSSKITKELLEDLYINKNMKMKDIAELLNVNVRTVNRAKNRYNLKRI